MHKAWLAAPCAAVFLSGQAPLRWRMNAAAQALCPDPAAAQALVDTLELAGQAGDTQGEFRGEGLPVLHWQAVPLDDGLLCWLVAGDEGAQWRQARIADLALGASGMGIWETDLVTGAMRWDAQVYALHGLKPDDPRPPNELQIVCPHPDDMHLALGPADLRSRERWDSEFRVVWPDGSVHWLASRAQTMHGADGRPLRLLGITWDITDAKERVAAERRRQAAEEASRAKSEFFARISHDLRTPTNTVLGHARLLLDDPVDVATPKQRQRGRSIIDAGELLLSMLSDLLDLGKIEAGTLTLVEEPIALAPLVEQTLHWLEPLGTRFGVELLAEPIDAHVLGDAHRVRQVVAKLLGNAVRYCRDGGRVTVSARLQPARRMVGLSVRDTGRGLSAEQLRSLFELRSRPSADAGIEGTRIGMGIVQDLVSRMRGHLEVKSLLGEGSDFTVWLREAPHPAPAAAARSALRPPGERDLPLDVLYIEDDPVNRLLMQEILLERRPATRLAFAEDGATGLARIAEQPPDLVLLDMHLPDMDGHELLRRIRASGIGTPCIAMSANAQPDAVAAARAAGFESFWTKPIDFMGFLPSLDAIAARRAAEPVDGGG